MVMAVKRLEPSTADGAPDLVVPTHGISPRLYHGAKERAVLFHPEYYVTTP